MSNGFAAFAGLIRTLGTQTKTNDKKEALIHYFHQADNPDKVWLIALFSGRRPRRTIKTSLLTQWCLERCGIKEWLFAECYHTVGDLAETLALLVPDSDDRIPYSTSLTDTIHRIKSLSTESEAEQGNIVSGIWRQLDKDQRFVFNKLITGNFRIGVSQQLMIQALAEGYQKEASFIAHRISGNWDPEQTEFDELIEGNQNADPSKPYPFYLAYALETEPEELGEPESWQAEWKWDGIRGQVIKRENSLFIWSRGEELMTEKFPELQVLMSLPDGLVLDGEIMCLKTEAFDQWAPLPFALLQTRIGRKNISRRQLQESPVGFICYDLLEFEGEDWRERPLTERRQQLESILRSQASPVLQLSPVLNVSTWEELIEKREQSRANGSEGLMLKRRTSTYQTGRKRGDWYKWKIDPLTIDGVMIYAQKGHGRRSNLFTDYTFAVRDGEQLVSFAKAYSGLTDKEFAEVDAFVKTNAVEKFGPVRTVKPELVFEIAFEGIAASNRHKSGVALRFPRISRWRKDKRADEINTLEDLKQLLERYSK